MMQVTRAAAGMLVLIIGLAMGELEIQPNHFGAYQDLGQAVETDFLGPWQPLSRFGAFITSSGIYDQNFEVAVTIGALYWNALPTASASQTGQLLGVGVGQAQGTYKFGDPESPAATLQMGLFGHKYNPDAQNLGEYLFRSGAYPAYLWTGGWSWLNSAAYMAQGLKLNLPTFGGMVTHDFTLYFERDFAPNHDISPGYMLTVKPASFFEISGGVVWQNGISFKPDSILSPKKLTNATYYDSLAAKRLPVQVGQNPPIVDTAGLDLEYYTYQGFKGMTRFSLNIGELTGLEGFKLYAEAALLGFKNYPYYYEKMSERAPIMLGLHIPTFGLLDLLAFEMEYLKSPFANSLYLNFDQQIPVPDVSKAHLPREGLWREDSLNLYVQDCSDDPTRHAECGEPDVRAAFISRYDAHTKSLISETEKDDWKWTVYAKKRFGENFIITAQAANDHQRQFSYVFAQVSKAPMTIKPSHWYYVLRIEFNI